MSELQIAMVVEGITDAVVLRVALDAILCDRPYNHTLLQPIRSDEGDKRKGERRGEGWGGVYRWCRDHKKLFQALNYEKNDLVIVQVDADVAEKSYADLGADPPATEDLPCAKPCPPASDTVEALEKVVLGWLNHDSR